MINSFVRKHWIKVSVLAILIFPIAYFAFIPAMLISSVLFDEIVTGTSFRFSSYIGQEVTVAPFATFDKTRWDTGWMRNYYYISSSAPASNSLRGQENPRSPIGDYVKLKVFDVKLDVTGIFSITELCLMRDTKKPDQVVTENCKEILNVSKVTDLFRNGEFEIQKYGSAYISLDDEFEITAFDPIFKMGQSNTYKVHSRQELIKVLTPGELPFDHYSWILYAHPALVKNRISLDKI